VGRGVYQVKDGETVFKQCVNANNLKPFVEQQSPSSPRTPTPRKARRCQPPTTPTQQQTTPPTPRQATSTHTPRRSITVCDGSQVNSDCRRVMWMSSLNLDNNDKELIATGDWLNDKIIGSRTLCTVLLFSGFGHYAQWGCDGRGGLLRIGS